MATEKKVAKARKKMEDELTEYINERENRIIALKSMVGDSKGPARLAAMEKARRKR